MSEPFDLDAVAREATGEPFTFIFGGELFSLPASPDVRFLDALGSERITDTVRLMFGEDWARVEASSTTLTAEVASALLNAYVSHLGTTQGKSSRSTGSSKSTAERSRRTSKPRTASA